MSCHKRTATDQWAQCNRGIGAESLAEAQKGNGANLPKGYAEPIHYTLADYRKRGFPAFMGSKQMQLLLREALCRIECLEKKCRDAGVEC